jgi:nucleoside 2-deoxyribosyltransferase
MKTGKKSEKHSSPDFNFVSVIIGSFRKHLPEIINIKKQLEKFGVSVLSPIDENVVNPNDEFILFKSDLITDPKLLQDGVFAKIKHSTFVVVANIDGYIGRAGTMEIGYAIANGITIYTLELVNDVHIAPYCRLLSEIFPGINPKSRVNESVLVHH